MIGDVTWDAEDERYPDAWVTFLAELSNLEPHEQLAFLQAPLFLISDLTLVSMKTPKTLVFRLTLPMAFFKSMGLAPTKHTSL